MMKMILRVCLGCRVGQTWGCCNATMVFQHAARTHVERINFRLLRQVFNNGWGDSNCHTRSWGCIWDDSDDFRCNHRCAADALSVPPLFASFLFNGWPKSPKPACVARTTLATLGGVLANPSSQRHPMPWMERSCLVKGSNKLNIYIYI